MKISNKELKKQMQRLCSSIRFGKTITSQQKTKTRIFNTNVKAVLLYTWETWWATEPNINYRQVFVNRCLRRVLNIKCQDMISKRFADITTYLTFHENCVIAILFCSCLALSFDKTTNLNVSIDIQFRDSFFCEMMKASKEHYKIAVTQFSLKVRYVVMSANQRNENL